MPRRSKKNNTTPKTETPVIEELETINDTTNELEFENNPVFEEELNKDNEKLELIEDKIVKYFPKIKFNFSSSLNVFLLILITYFVLTAMINYKSILTGYERIFLNDFKDLFYWLRFTLGATAIVYFCFFVVGIDLKKEIQEDNKSAVYFALGLIAVTYFFGQKLFN